MATFESIKSIPVRLYDLEPVALETMAQFQNIGFETTAARTLTGGYDISLCKSKIFKPVLGMKSALKISIEPRADETLVVASIGIFDKRSVPAVISVLVFWPVLLAQLWELVKQHELDDKAICIIESRLMAHHKTIADCKPAQVYDSWHNCRQCGTKLSPNLDFCPTCSQKQY